MKRCIAGLVLLNALALPAASHDHWIRNGKYMDATTNTHCCNEDDCKEMSPADIEGVLTTAAGIIVGGVIFLKGQLHKSEDGKWYRCANRCVFRPVEG